MLKPKHTIPIGASPLSLTIFPFCIPYFLFFVFFPVLAKKYNEKGSGSKGGKGVDRDCAARCAFFGGNLHSMLPLVRTPARLKVLHACNQWYSSRAFTLLLPVGTVNSVQTLKARKQIQHSSQAGPIHLLGAWCLCGFEQASSPC
jgi:hypothetical protein